jgi:sulfate transport system permease protein
VVSGHIRGETNTMPLHVEILYNEYNFAAAFAVASLLALLALLTLAAQILPRRRMPSAPDLARSYTVTEAPEPWSITHPGHQ